MSSSFGLSYNADMCYGVGIFGAVTRLCFSIWISMLTVSRLWEVAM